MSSSESFVHRMISMCKLMVAYGLSWLHAVVAHYIVIGVIFKFILPRIKHLTRGIVPIPEPPVCSTTVSKQWMSSLLGNAGIMREPIHVEVEDIKANRGLAGDIRRIAIQFVTGKMTMVMKSSRTDTLAARRSSISSGQVREYLFYNHFGTTVFHDIVPLVYYASGNRFTGDYTVVMEDLSDNYTGVNMYLGNQIWGADLPRDKYVPEAVILEKVFEAAADLHSSHWNDKNMFKYNWLKNVNWYEGNGQESWSMGLDMSRRRWLMTKNNMSNTGVQWSSKLISIIDRSFENTTWERFQDSLTQSPYTLVHGDHHAANMFWHHSQHKTVLVDWSEVGVWEPTTDLGQMMISDVKVSTRRNVELKLLKIYHKKLMDNGVPVSYTMDKCLYDYERGGVEKWLFMLPILATYGLPDAAVQYFHDQTLSFIEDHNDHAWYLIRPVTPM